MGERSFNTEYNPIFKQDCDWPDGDGPELLTFSAERSRDSGLFLKSLITGALVLSLGFLGIWTGNLLLIPSLAPSVVLRIVCPEQYGSRNFDFIVGHALGIFSGLVSLGILNAQNDPSLLQGHASPHRIWASAIGIILMLFLQTASRSFHPPAAATVLLLTSGMMRSHWTSVRDLLSGIVVLTLMTELLRKLQSLRS